MINYKIIENFIDEDDCNKLIEDAQKILNLNSENEVLNNNRQLISSTSITYNNFLSSSQNWSKLHDKLYSNIFYAECLKNLNIEKNKFELSNFFFKKNLTDNEKKYKKLINKKFSYIKTATLIKLILFRIYNQILFKIKFFLKRKINLELIYDFSISRKGYKREIHRDSDSRVIVFLLYLNTFENNIDGGSLNLHEIKNKNLNFIPPQPKANDCSLIQSINPKAGRLVLFLNSAEAFHSVSEMVGNQERFFLYGSFTALNKKNPYLAKSLKGLDTDFYFHH